MPTVPSTKTILLVVPRGVAGRFMLQTEVLPTLQEAGVRVVALTPEAAMPQLSARADPDALVIERLNPPAPFRGAKYFGLAQSVLRVMRDASLSGRRSPGFAGRYNRVRAAYSGTWPSWVSRPVHVVVTQLLWRSRGSRRGLARLELALSRHAEHAQVFDRYQPDLVVGSGLGYFPHDEALYQEAAKRGVRVAALISGWDNPSTKGYRAVDLDLVVAWSDQMKRAVVDLHDIPPTRVAVAGVPHWDAYMIEDALPDRVQLCADLGLDPDKRLILHATFPPSATNPEPFERIAAGLASATGEGALGDDVQLVLRLHPKFMGAEHEEARRPYEQLAQHPGVHLNHPDMPQEGPLRHEPTHKDGQTLGALLKHCDVLVNIFSTTTLEGFLLDRPVVMATPADGFGAYEVSKVSDPRLWDDFVHLAPLVNSGAAQISRSPEELLDHIRGYLAHPELHAEQRREIARLECGPTDGHAGERTAAALLEALEAPRSSSRTTPGSA